MKFAKPILIAIALAFSLLVAVYLGINLYLQSDTVQGRVREAASEALGGPIVMGGTSFTPWGGLSLSDIELRDPGTGDVLFQADRLRFQVPLLPLLSQRVVITSASLLNPTIAWQEGRTTWRMPSPKVTERPIPRDPETPGSKPSRSSYRVEVQTATITNGSFVLRNSNGQQAAVLTGIQVRSKIANPQEVSGTFRCAQIRLGSGFFLREVEVPFAWKEGGLELTPISAILGDGQLTGSVEVDQGTGMMQSAFALEGASVPALLSDANVPSGRAEGLLRGQAQLTGSLQDAASLSGSGFAELIESKLEPVEFIRQVGQLFRIDELQLLSLSEARSDFLIADQQVILQQLTLKSENLQILAEGTMDFEGNMNLPARLLLNEKLQRNLRAMLGKNLEPAPEEGYKQITFSVTGHVSRPQTDLIEKVSGVRIGSEVGNILQNLFRAPKKPKNEGD